MSAWECALDGDLAALRALVERSPRAVKETNSYGSLPLHLAAHNGHVAVVDFLVRCGSPVDLADRSLRTALYYAVWNGHRTTAVCLVRAGASLDVTPVLLPPLVDVLETRDMRDELLHEERERITRRWVASSKRNCALVMLLPLPLPR